MLISGAGIAGPTLAWWLLRYGFRPTLVERAPRLRSGGYIVDFWGLGYDVAERMGLLPALARESYRVEAVRFVDADGKAAGSFSADVFRRLTDGRFMSLPRCAWASRMTELGEALSNTLGQLGEAGPLRGAGAGSGVSAPRPSAAPPRPSSAARRPGWGRRAGRPG